MVLEDSIHDLANATSVWHQVEDKLEHMGYPNAFLMIAIGLTLLIFGKKLMKLTVFASGLVTVGYALFCSFVAIGDASNMSTDAIAYGAVGVGIAGGLLGGLLATKFISLGLFLVGAGGGASVGTYFQHIIFAEIFSDANSVPSYAPYLVIIGFALIGGFLLACLKDKLYCLVASILGAFCVTQGWVFLAKYPNLVDIVEGHHDDDVDVQKIWAEIGSVIALSILGTLYQWDLLGSLLCCGSGSQKRRGDVHASLIDERVPDDTFV